MEAAGDAPLTIARAPSAAAPAAEPAAELGTDSGVQPRAVGRWRSERLFFTGDEYLAALIADIGSARRAVTLETYIFDLDAIGERVEEALAAAAARGVHVRLLVDGWGAGSWSVARAHALVERGVEVRVFHPVPVLLTPRGATTLRKRQLVGWLRSLNRRDHRKVCVIDGRVAFVGSVNVSAHHSACERGPAAWRDTVARVEGRGIVELERAFEHTWRRSYRVGRAKLRVPPPRRRRRRSLAAAGLVRLNHRLRLREFWYRELTRRIRWAQRRVWITNAYFVPNGRLVRALAHAARRGCDVRVLVPAKSDVPFMPWVAAAFYHALTRAGVRVFEYQPCILHAKTMILDDWVTVGSSNLNTRSLKHDLEVDVVLNEPESLAAMERQFVVDLGHAREQTVDVLRARPWWQQLLARAALRLRYWM